ncbi:hypothetical protein FOL47_000575 [Perkinsus chesapeaki]|uniref:PHD-type domain-containing protein n=1 Tax=Perkinsus chesapeaki TaxID=330153 RepID=A0A7J6MLD0_PERCH|nr:hypothetical protein FOL47_000575 [Perkinsus chesapeaki]
MATTTATSSSTSSSSTTSIEAAEHAGQSSHNMRFLQYRSSQNSCRVGANYQAVVPLVLPPREKAKLAADRKEIKRADEENRTPELTDLAAGLCDALFIEGSAGPFLQADIDAVMDALEARKTGGEMAIKERQGEDWFEESTRISNVLNGRNLRRNQWAVEEVRGVGRGLEELERWRQVVGMIVSGGKRVGLAEASALWYEGRVLEKVYDGLHSEVVALHRLILPAERFEARVAQGSEERMEELVKEGQALQIIPEVALKCLAAAAAESGNPPRREEKSFPSSTSGEWSQKARSKLGGKKSHISLHVVESLLEDLDSKGFRDEADNEIVKVLEKAQEAGRGWLDKALRAIAVDQAQLGGKTAMEGLEEVGGPLTTSGLRELWREHGELPRVSVPEVCHKVESLLRRGMGWERRCREMLEQGRRRAPVEGRLLLEEIRQSGIAKAVDLSKILGEVKVAVEDGEQWGRHAEAAMEAWEIGYTRKICVACDRLSIDEQGPALVSPKAGGNRSTSGPAFVENLMEELRWQVALYDKEIRENLENLPSCKIFLELRASGGELRLRDDLLYEKIRQIGGEVDKWESRVKELTDSEAATFPRPSGGLRALSFFFMDYLRTGIAGTRAREPLEDLLTAMREEVWAWDVRKEVSNMPMNSSVLRKLSESYPSRLKILQRAEEGSDSPRLVDISSAQTIPQQASEFDRALLEIEKACTLLIESLPTCQERWNIKNSRDGQGNVVQEREESASASLDEDYPPYIVRRSTWAGEWDLIAALGQLESSSSNMLRVKVPIEIASWKRLSAVVERIDRSLVREPELITKVDGIIAENSELERRTLRLVQRMVKCRVAAIEQDGVKGEENVSEEKKDEKEDAKKRKAEEEAEPSLFGQLLELLGAVDASKSRVTAFESSLRALVNALLEWQRRARELFHWDEKENRIEGTNKPIMSEVSQYVRELDEDPVLKDFVTRDFLMQVGFISGAIAAEEAAQGWQQEVSELLVKKEEAAAAPAGSSESTATEFSLGALRKLMGRLDSFDVEVAVEESFLKAAGEADQWLSFYQSRRSRKKRLSLQSAEEVIRAASMENEEFTKSRELIQSAEEWRTLSRQISDAKENWKKSMETILDSYTRRITGGGGTAAATTPIGTAENGAPIDPVEANLQSLLAASKKLFVYTGADKWLSRELRARSDNTKLSEALTDSNCTLERARQICHSVDAPSRMLKSPGSEESFADGPGECPEELRHAAFTCDGHLLSELERAVEEATVLELQVNHCLKVTSDSVEENVEIDQAIDNVIDLAIRDALIQGRLQPGIDGVPDYAYPLPLYYPPKKPSKKSKALELLATEGPSESLPLSMRILDLAPWDAPRVSRVEPPVEMEIRKRRRVLSTLTPDQRRAEKSALMARLQSPKPTVPDCISLLAWSRRLRLKVPEIGELRKVVGSTMRSVRTILRKLRVLRPPSGRVSASDLREFEPWELHLSTEVSEGQQGNEDEGAETKPLVMVTIDDLLEALIKIDRLPLAVSVEYRVITIIEAAFDWRVRAQCLVHNLSLDRTRPRPWVGDRRTLEYWATHNQRCTDIFEFPDRLPNAPLLPQACENPVLAPPVEGYIRNTLQMRFFYIVECCRHFSTVYTDMCEICNVVTTLYTDTDAWITCDVCDKWYHQKCAGVSPDATSFTCPTCVNGGFGTTGEMSRRRGW